MNTDFIHGFNSDLCMKSVSSVAKKYNEDSSCRFQLPELRAFNLELFTRTTRGQRRFCRGRAGPLRATAGAVVSRSRARAGDRVSKDRRWLAGAECLRRFAERSVERRARLKK